jgi:alpha-methylacyl-CoA racemase
MAGPLEGVRIIEMAGIGPGPFAGMMLADHGAEVIRVDRPGRQAPEPVLGRNRKSIVVDLKTGEGIQVVRDLAKSADGFFEGLRPGVMERLGLGPDTLLADNPRLVYGRMTGWGQTGPYAPAAGHDINYIALAGALHAYGRAGEKPTPPINMVGDFGGGGMMLAYGMVCAILSARTTGRGQVIDCAMTEGAAVLMGMIWGFRGMGAWKDERGVNMLDTGAHFYDTYQCADGKFVSLGSIEPQFYALLRQLTGLDADPDFDAQMDSRQWAHLKAKLTALFKSQPRDHWCRLMEMTDVCFAPVLSMADAPDHPHNKARGAFAEIGGMVQPMPAPRYSGTATALPTAAPAAGSHTNEILAGLGYDGARLQALKDAGALGR